MFKSEIRIAFKFVIWFVTFNFLFCSDYDDFMEDLEEDEDLRRDVRVYRDSKKAIVDDSNDGLDLNIPEIGLEEMLDDLVIEDVEMDENIDEES